MSSLKARIAVLCFVKNPEPGKVKTRIAKTVGEEEALEIYHRLLHYTKSVLDDFPATKKLYFSSRIEPLTYWPDDGYSLCLQSGGHLGERMANAFSTELALADKVIIIGSDCAELKTEHLHKASIALERSDVVIGPARDGGYYLIGLNRFIPGLFENMPWSESHLLDKTLSYLKNSNYSFDLLEELSDVDQYEDWQQVDWK